MEVEGEDDVGDCRGSPEPISWEGLHGHPWKAVDPFGDVEDDDCDCEDDDSPYADKGEDSQPFYLFDEDEGEQDEADDDNDEPFGAVEVVSDVGVSRHLSSDVSDGRFDEYEFQDAGS